MQVVAINIQPQYPLQAWRRFWKENGGGDVLWAQDTENRAAVAYRILTLGVTVMVDRSGHIAFRNNAPVPYAALKNQVEQALSQ